MLKADSRERCMAVDLDKIRAICERVAASLGLEVVDIEFRGGAGKQGRLLRIYIDRVGIDRVVPAKSDSEIAGVRESTPGPELTETGVAGVTLEDCANVSREVSTILDVEDAVPVGDYVLEVSSPGLDRKLSKPADFERFVGSRVKLMTHEPVGVTEKSKGNRHFEGRLERFHDGQLTLDVSPSRKKKQKPGEPGQQLVVIEFANVERANLVPEI